MISLYRHQVEGIDFLVKRPGALLMHEMGLGKSRTALLAAVKLAKQGKIDRLLILAPAAVRFAWQDEIAKLLVDDVKFTLVFYNAKKQEFHAVTTKSGGLPVLIGSYALLPQERHAKAFEKWCFEGEAALVCDESSFLKNRTAKQTKAAARIARSCSYTWLLTGTPIANSPLDLYGQAFVMSNGNGPLKGFANFYHFRSRYATTQPMRFGNGRVFQQVTGYQNLDELTKRFAPYVSRVEKKDALDLPEKTYSVREVALDVKTWAIYQELKREAMLALPDSEERPEPNAAVRILRLCQLTNGHVGTIQTGGTLGEVAIDGVGEPGICRDISSEKLDYLTDSILDGELSSTQALIVWCRWRRERERLQQMLATKIEVYRIFGGQQEKSRSFEIGNFMASTKRRVMVAQPHAGGYGLTLTAASTAVYLSNTFSHIDRVQSEDRMHRIGQNNSCLYIDVLATGPKGQHTVDHHVFETLREKKSLAETTCSAWRRVLEQE